MVSYREALDLLLQNTPSLAVEDCCLEEAGGRVLREGISADRDFPAFDRVMMDGHALRSSDWDAGVRFFKVTGAAPAGAPKVSLSSESGTCVEVMTGAPVPVGADGIVPVEEVTSRSNGGVEYSGDTVVTAGEYIHRQGSDAAKGQQLLADGIRLGSREIGVAASCGAAVLRVSSLPGISVIATGDELVPVEEIPAEHQIRQSNGHSLATALKLAGYPVKNISVLIDEIEVAKPAMEKLLAAHEWLILSGAVSMGSRDFVPSLLDSLGCRKLFHGVAHRPGKPAGCWIGPQGQMIIALPGNPVSALTGLHVFVLPALAKASGLTLPETRRVVMEDSRMQLEKFTRHLPVRLRADGRAEPAATGNSGDFIGLLGSDGFVTIPPREEGETAAVAFPFTPWF